MSRKKLNNYLKLSIHKAVEVERVFVDFSRIVQVNNCNFEH